MYDEISFTIRDNPNTKDFYAININNNLQQLLLEQNQYSYGSGKFITDADVDADEDGLDIGANGSLHYGKIYLKDANFNGQTKIFKMLVSNNNSTPTPNPNLIKRYVSIENLSENAYKYEKTKQLYDMNDGNPFSEPVQVQNNVIGGNGIFYLKNVLIDSLL